MNQIRIIKMSEHQKPRKKRAKRSSERLLAELLRISQVKLGCDICASIVKKSGLCKLNNMSDHVCECQKNVLVLFDAQKPGTWRIVRSRPTGYNPLTTDKLCQCINSNEPCIEGQFCPYPHSSAEQDLWRKDFHRQLSIANLIEDLRETSLHISHTVGCLCRKFDGSFRMICRRCHMTSDVDNRVVSFKRHHVPVCSADGRHDWTRNGMLVFETLDKRLVTFGEECENVDDLELFNSVRLMISNQDANEDIIFEEAARIWQKHAPRAIRNMQVQNENDELWLEYDESVPDDDDNEDAFLVRADSDLYDSDVDRFLDKRIFDEDTGDVFEADRNDSASSVSRSYYRLMTESEVTSKLTCLISEKSLPKFVCGKIHLDGPYDGVCRITGGANKIGFDVQLRGRMNCGPAFEGDEVLVEMFFPKEPSTKGSEFVYCGTVVGIVKRNVHRAARTFVCSVDIGESNLMTPLCGSAPRFRVVSTCLKQRFGPTKKDNYVAVYNLEAGKMTLNGIIKLDAVKRREMLFLVKYLKWDNARRYPLGFVCGTLHHGEDLEKGQKVLRILYEVPATKNADSDCDDGEMSDNDDGDNDDVTEVQDQFRKDLTDLPTISIDRRGTKLIDDALSVIEEECGTFSVWVHVADVTHFVQKDDGLDRDARCPSQQHSDGSLHILPRRFVKKRCSLNENQRRHALSIHFTLNAKLIADDNDDYDDNDDDIPEVVLSCVKNDKEFSFDEVQKVIDGKRINGIDPKLRTMISRLHYLAKRLRQKRIGDGQYFFEYKNEENFDSALLEDPFALDQNHDARNLVEEFMILTNSAVGSQLSKYFPDCVPLRQQDGPPKGIIDAFKPLHKHSGPFSFYFKQYPCTQIPANPHQNPIPLFMLQQSWKCLREAAEEGDWRKVKTIIGSEELHPMHNVAIRSWYKLMAPATFVRSGNTKGEHFCLQKSNYVFFTSPIRRYADIVIHRLLKASMLGAPSPYTVEETDRLCELMNVHTRRREEYIEARRLLEMTILLQEPVHLHCIVDETDDFGLYLTVPYFHGLSKNRFALQFSEMGVHGNPKQQSSDKTRENVTLHWQQRFYDIKKPNRKNRNADVEFELDSGMFGKVVDKSLWADFHHTIKDLDRDPYLACDNVLQLMDDNIDDDIDAAAAAADDDDDDDDDDELAAEAAVGHRVVREVTSEPKDTECFTTHHVRFCLSISVGTVMYVQFGAEFVKGSQKPVVKLVRLTDEKEICIEHRRDPVRCFAAEASEKTKDAFENIEEYQRIWLRILSMEAATNAATTEDRILCEHVPIELYRSNGDTLYGKIILDKAFCKKRHIAIYKLSDEETHDFLCVRFQYPSEMRKVWVGHGIVVRANANKESKFIEIRVKFCHQNSRILKHAFVPGSEFSVELLQRTLPDKCMAEAVNKLQLETTSELCRRIVLNRAVNRDDGSTPTRPFPGDFEIPLLRRNGQISKSPNNEKQKEAIREAMTRTLTLIQGPPGTGKTLVGVKIVYWFVQKNKKSVGTVEIRRQVMFCGPSNSAVDVAASTAVKLFKKLEPEKRPKIVRVYSKTQENLDFPVPRDILSFNQQKQKRDPALTDISLHHVIRKEGQHHSQIVDFDEKFKSNRDTPELVTDDEIESYYKLTTDASIEELKSCDVIFCTCSSTMSRRLKAGTDIAQIIIDECAMCMEPETLVPLVSFSSTEQIVLIGDHKQLQPIVKNRDAKNLGLQKSLFERYADSAIMLEEQYRMHESICTFPSDHFYGGLLRTAGKPERQDRFRACWLSQHPTVFCHVEGVELTQAVSTPEGNEQSKKNDEERCHVIRILKELVNKTQQEDILHTKANSKPHTVAILSQYKAQCSAIEADLKQQQQRLEQSKIKCSVSTVVASQGNEWDYVILSTVRSLPEYEIDPKPSIGWCYSKMGFICDEHQINVALTRAKLGLIIIGNKNLLRCHPMWRALLQHYEQRRCDVDADQFLPNPPGQPSPAVHH